MEPVTPATEEEAIVERLRGQLALALSLLLSLGFDYVELTDYLWS